MSLFSVTVLGENRTVGGLPPLWISPPHHIISPIFSLYWQAQSNDGKQSEGRWSSHQGLGLWSPRRQLRRGRAERNKVRRLSLYTNLVNGNWLLLVTRTGPRTKSSGFSIKQCQILMIFLFPASRMNSLILPVVLMNVCYCLLLLLSFCFHFHQLLARMEQWYFLHFFFFFNHFTANKTRINAI